MNWEEAWERLVEGSTVYKGMGGPEEHEGLQLDMDGIWVVDMRTNSPIAFIGDVSSCDKKYDDWKVL